MKDRSIDWCETRILQVLKNKGQVTSYLKMSSLVLAGGVRSLAEKHNLDTAIGRLLLAGKIKYGKTSTGIRVYQPVKQRNRTPKGNQ
jgi:hypothetical protein